MEEGAMTTTTTTSGNAATTRNKVYHDRDRRLREIQKCRSEKRRWEQEIQKCRSEKKRWENRLEQLLLEEDETVVVTTSGEGGITELHLVVLQFLHPADVASCAQVCHQWNRYIDTHPNVWKMAAVNVSSAKFVETFFVKFYRSSLASSSSSPEIQLEDIPPPPPTNFKNIAFGLIYEPQQSRINVGLMKDVLRLEKCKPKLRAQDIIICFEINDTESGTVLSKIAQGITTHADGKLHGFITTTKTKFSRTSRNLHDNISFKLRIFRNDTGQSINWDLGRRKNTDTRNVKVYQLSDRKQPDANTDSGIVATDLWRIRKYVGMYPVLWYKVESVRSGPNIPREEHKITRVVFTFKVDRGHLGARPARGIMQASGGIEHFLSLKDILLSLEGLDWN